MGLSHQFQKLLTRVRQDGLTNATTAAINHVGRTISRQLVGLPGYYHGQLWRLQRWYDRESVASIQVSPENIVQLTGDYKLRDQGHLDYVPYFKPREANWDEVSFEQEVPYGTVIDGGWDQEQEPFSRLLMYQGTRQRFVDEREWSETVYYGKLVDRFYEQGWDSSDAETLAMERCERIETLHDRIERHGYRSQRELNGHPLHEVTVTVGRDGEVLYNCEGRHRLCVAKVLGIERIPVLVLAKHTDFNGSIGTTEPQGEEQ